jgi:type IV pilus assembly protein PilV
MKFLNARQAGGFTLIEMLIALLVLSIGLLGVAALQMRGQQYNYAAYIRTQGTALAYEIMDRMRANIACADDVVPRPVGFAAFTPPDPMIAGCALGYGASSGSTLDCATNACTPAELRDFDLNQWQQNIAGFLPNGAGQVTWNGGVNPPVYDITISWQDRDETDENDTPVVYSQNWTFRP